MTDLDYVLTRIQQGARVRLLIDYYGQQTVEVTSSWLPIRKRIKLDPDQLDHVRQALRAGRGSRRTGRDGAGAPLPDSA